MSCCTMIRGSQISFSQLTPCLSLYIITVDVHVWVYRRSCPGILKRAIFSVSENLLSSYLRFYLHKWSIEIHTVQKYMLQLAVW